MITTVCDICQQEVSGVTILYNQYKVSGVNEVCTNCEETLKGVLNKSRMIADIHVKNAVRKKIISMKQS